MTDKVFALLNGGDPAALNPPARFAALRNRDCRWYLGGGLLSMMADNIEQYICERG